jgi:hypothetical protein
MFIMAYTYNIYIHISLQIVIPDIMLCILCNKFNLIVLFTCDIEGTHLHLVLNSRNSGAICLHIVVLNKY